jgi:PPOX class probable FMN-dependent enzyme
VSDDLTYAIETEEALRKLYEQPSKGAVAKEIRTIDTHCSNFIGLSPFICIGTMNANGAADISPRGGEPGFVHVLSSTRLAIPDRPGNNRLDSMLNIISNPAAALLFFVPGFEEMLRVNGLARITTDPALISRFSFNGRLPASVMLIEVQEAQLHCAKAIKRAGLWNPATFVDRKSFPTAGQVLRDHLGLETPVAAIDAFVEKDARERLY